LIEIYQRYWCGVAAPCMAQFIEMNRNLPGDTLEAATGGACSWPPSHLCTFPHRQTIQIGAQYAIFDF